MRTEIKWEQVSFVNIYFPYFKFALKDNAFFIHIKHTNYEQNKV